MKLTLLLDLDDTLLGNNMDTFLPAYFHALSRQLGQFAASDEMLPALLAGTRAMVANTSPARTLEAAFDAAFYPGLGLDKAALQEVITRFYEEEFPKLRSVTQPIPAAVDLIRHATDCGYDIVIATNPLFPLRAVEHRLEWAGVPKETYPYRLVGNYRQFHFSKPGPAYYAEILGQLGWPNQPAVMIGNDLNDDILPASTLGLPVYWVTGDPDASLPESAHPRSSAGTLAKAVPWMDGLAGNRPLPLSDRPEASLAILRSTPAAIDSLMRSRSESDWTARPKPGEWSATEIICHLRDADCDVNLPRLQRVLQEENPLLSGINTDAWAEERQYARQDGCQALAEFIRVRVSMIRMLEALPAEDWSRPARHTIFGPTTLQELVGFIATHDRTHLQQLTAALP